jgi:hypothetical protein
MSYFGVQAVVKAYLTLLHAETLRSSGRDDVVLYIIACGVVGYVCMSCYNMPGLC